MLRLTLFQPLRTRATRVANRLVYGERATPYQVLSDFAADMAGQLLAARPVRSVGHRTFGNTDPVLVGAEVDTGGVRIEGLHERFSSAVGLGGLGLAARHVGLHNEQRQGHGEDRGHSCLQKKGAKASAQAGQRRLWPTGA